jgi:transposase
MPKRIALRSLTTEEEAEIRRLAKSRTAAMRLVQRAQVIQAMLDDPSLPASRAGEKAGFKGAPGGIRWVKRFNESGIAGLEDEERAGRPPTHSQEVRSALLDLALQKPRSLGYPFELWTLERLQIAFKERHGLHLSDSTIWTWVEDEGFRWRKQESWFHEPEKHDPEFVE